jgi:hypothetical protein
MLLLGAATNSIHAQQKVELMHVFRNPIGEFIITIRQALANIMEWAA